MFTKSMSCDSKNRIHRITIEVIDSGRAIHANPDQVSIQHITDIWIVNARRRTD